MIILILAAAWMQAPCTHEQPKLTWPYPDNFEEFGGSLDVDGDVLVVGSPREKNLAGPGQGAAYVYARTGTTWTIDYWASAFDAAQGDRFGTTVDLDGDTLLVGSPKDDDLGPSSGSAYVFRKNACCWVFQAKIVSPEGVPNERFSDYMALDGDTAVFGVPSSSGTAGAYSGAAYIFERTGTTWTYSTRLTASDAAVGDQFGNTVGVAGSAIAIGCPYDDDLGFSSGSVYFFVKAGNNWVERSKLTAPGGGPGDIFGNVSLLDDCLAVGAPGHDVPLQGSGTVYIFRANGSAWIFEAQLASPSPFQQSHFGLNISIGGDMLAWGWVDPNTPATPGSAFAFLREGTTWGPPHEVVPSDGAPGDAFGRAVVAHDRTLFVGAPLDDDGATDAGSLYSFDFYDAPATYCQGKQNSTGCIPFLTTAGEPSATSLQAFWVVGEDVLPAEPGVLLYAHKKSSLGFHGGRLCIKVPFRRTAAKTPKAHLPSCNQVALRFDFNQRIRNGLDPLLTTGQRVFAQWYQRDPSDPPRLRRLPHRRRALRNLPVSAGTNRQRGGARVKAGGAGRRKNAPGADSGMPGT